MTRKRSLDDGSYQHLDAAVVVYLRRALGIAPEPVFPLQEASGLAAELARIEAGRELFARAAPEAVRWLEGHGEEVRGALLRRGAARVSFEARDEFARGGFDVSAGS